VMAVLCDGAPGYMRETDAALTIDSREPFRATSPDARYLASGLLCVDGSAGALAWLMK